MEFDGVDALASHIEGMQNRWVAIREAGVLRRGRRAQSSSRAEQVGCGRPGPLTMHRFLQCLIGGEEVVLRQSGRLVKDSVGGRWEVHGGARSIARKQATRVSQEGRAKEACLGNASRRNALGWSAAAHRRLWQRYCAE